MKMAIKMNKKMMMRKKMEVQLKEIKTKLINLTLTLEKHEAFYDITIF